MSIKLFSTTGSKHIVLSGRAYTPDSDGIITVEDRNAADFGGLVDAGCIPLSVLAQFGSAASTMSPQGNLYSLVNGAGVNPGALGADIVLAVFALPADCLDGTRNRGLSFQANGSFANNPNAKRVKILFNPLTAVVGSAIGSGGVAIADTGAYSTAALSGWQLTAQVFKYGPANSNTQVGFSTGIVVGSAHSGLGSGAAGVPQLIRATEKSPILVAVVGNTPIAAIDLALNFFAINAMN